MEAYLLASARRPWDHWGVSLKSLTAKWCLEEMPCLSSDFTGRHIQVHTCRQCLGAQKQFQRRVPYRMTKKNGIQPPVHQQRHEATHKREVWFLLLPAPPFHLVFWVSSCSPTTWAFIFYLHSTSSLFWSTWTDHWATSQKGSAPSTPSLAMTLGKKAFGHHDTFAAVTEYLLYVLVCIWRLLFGGLVLQGWDLVKGNIVFFTTESRGDQSLETVERAYD